MEKFGNIPCADIPEQTRIDDLFNSPIFRADFFEWASWSFVQYNDIYRDASSWPESWGTGVWQMDLTFDRGSQESPKGHTILYFRSIDDPDQCWATYIVILPILVDVSKYVPPFLMNQMGEIGPTDLSAFAFPPAPEQVSGYGYIEELASGRDDDVLYGGTMNTTDISSALMVVNEAITWYAELYADNTAPKTELELEESDEALPGFGVNEGLYGLMSDNDKLGELTRQVGRLRDAVNTGDQGLARETQEEIAVLGHHLPENHQIAELVEAAGSGDEIGAKLADLYLQRCFHLISEEYVKVGEVESEIRLLEAGGPFGQ